MFILYDETVPTADKHCQSLTNLCTTLDVTKIIFFRPQRKDMSRSDFASRSVRMIRYAGYRKEHHSKRS